MISNVGKLKQEFKKHNIDINIVYKSNKLKNLPIQSNSKKHQDSNYQSGAIYHLFCKLCTNKVDYIGETGSPINARLAEHFTNGRISSTLFEPATHALAVHQKNSPDNWDVKILKIVKNEVARKIEEAKAISNFKPILNKNVGLT